MDSRTRTQIGLIIDRERSLAMRRFIEGRTATFQTFASQGRLQSGATVKVVLGDMGFAVDQLIDNLAVALAGLSQDTESWTLLSNTVGAFLDELFGHVNEVVRVASGGERMGSVVNAAAEIFAQIRSDCDQKLEILAFEFADPSTSTETVQALASVSRAKGGRPLAEFWDDMWAAIATALYEGTLVPKTQADIERAMSSWIELSGYSAADSTVRARARRLWDKLTATDE